MIAHVAGEVSEKRMDSVIVDVGGIGYEIHVTTRDLEKILLNSGVTLHTYFAVRENAQDLYGFTTPESKQLFELLLSVSGVGPKVAMSITSLGEPNEIKSAIASSNVAYIQSANGVGKRGAEKVIVELKDKVGVLGSDSFAISDLQSQDDASSALIALGYNAAQAAQVLAKIDPNLSVEERIKLALSKLSNA